MNLFLSSRLNNPNELGAEAYACCFDDDRDPILAFDDLIQALRSNESIRNRCQNVSLDYPRRVVLVRSRLWERSCPCGSSPFGQDVPNVPPVQAVAVGSAVAAPSKSVKE
jgi:hypothetical protein